MPDLRQTPCHPDPFDEVYPEQSRRTQDKGPRRIFAQVARVRDEPDSSRMDPC
jgi:hypothetical protein